MEKANRVAFISYCDTLGLGNRILLGVKSPCEHRRLSDPLSKYILKTRKARWIQPEGPIYDNSDPKAVESLDGHPKEIIDSESRLKSIIAEAEDEADDRKAIARVRSCLSWEARSLNLLEAKYEPFSMFIVNCLISASEMITIVPSLYNYFVMQSVSKIIIIAPLSLRPSELAPLQPLTVGEHQLHKAGRVADSARSSASHRHGYQLCEVLFNDCPSFGFNQLTSSDWLNADPFLSNLAQLLTFSRIPGAILGPLNMANENQSNCQDDNNWSGIMDCAWRITSSIQKQTGVAFEMDLVESIQFIPNHEDNAKQQKASIYL